MDFSTTTLLQAPRGFPKLASIATGAGLFLGGTPSVVLDDVLYYAGDDYVQNTDKPTLNRFDGRLHSEVTELPFITGSTPSKAILSLATDGDDRIFISTWDSGTNSSDFAGRIYAYDITEGSTTRIDEGLFTGGKLPYALAWFNSALYVGVTKQDPANTTEVIRINAFTARSGGPTLTLSLPTSTYTYRILAENSSNAGIGKSNTVNVTNANTLSSGSRENACSWTSLAGTARYKVERLAASSNYATGVIAVGGATTTSDSGLAVVGGAGATTEPENIVLTVTPTPTQATTNTYQVGAIVGGIEYLSNAVSINNCPATLTSGFYVSLSWTSVANATSYKIYRTAGHTSTGLISTTTSTSLNDTGLAGSGSVPSISSSIALTSGAVGCLVVYNSELYVGSYQPAGTFGKVFKITTGDVLSTSDTIAPGGTAQAYNGFTAGIVFESNLYMGYWNDDATDVAIIRKFDGSSWTTVSTISGAGARPWMCFAEADGNCWAYGGGDAKTGILYKSADGSSWSDQSALLPSAVEAIPFIASINVIGGF